MTASAARANRVARLRAAANIKPTPYSFTHHGELRRLMSPNPVVDAVVTVK